MKRIATPRHATSRRFGPFSAPFLASVSRPVSALVPVRFLSCFRPVTTGFPPYPFRFPSDFRKVSVRLPSIFRQVSVRFPFVYRPVSVGFPLGLRPFSV